MPDPRLAKPKAVSLAKLRKHIEDNPLHYLPEVKEVLKKILPEKCECGRELENATFLSESFNWSGGTMIFKCECGKEWKRGFVPSDLLSMRSKKQWITVLAIQLMETEKGAGT